VHVADDDASFERLLDAVALPDSPVLGLSMTRDGVLAAIGPQQLMLVDTLTTDRPYRSALTVEGALDVLVLGSGAQWDPDVVEKISTIVRPYRDLSTRETPPVPPRSAGAGDGEVKYDPLEAFIKYLQITGDRP
jgi:hypothetical protein